MFSEPLAGWHSGAVTSYLTISFNKSLRILLDDLNPAGIYYYHKEWGYFHAVYNEVTAPVPENSLYPVLSVSGRGKYIGTFDHAFGGINYKWRSDDSKSGKVSVYRWHIFL